MGLSMESGGPGWPRYVVLAASMLGLFVAFVVTLLLILP